MNNSYTIIYLKELPVMVAFEAGTLFFAHAMDEVTVNSIIDHVSSMTEPYLAGCIDVDFRASRYVFIPRTVTIGEAQPVLQDPTERIEAAAIIRGYQSGKPPFDGWHFIDNANNDLLREIIKQLFAMVGVGSLGTT